MHNSPQSSASNKKHLKFILAAALTAVLTVSAFTIFAVNSAPPPSFTVPCQITTYGNAWTGDLTYGLYQFDPSNSNLTVASYLIIMDTEANLVRLREWPGSSYFGSVNYINPDLMLFQGEGGSSVNLWNLTTNAVTRYSNITGHHDAEYDPVNNTFLMLNNYVREVNGNKYLFDKIVQFNSTGSIIWTWDTYDHIPLSQQNIYNLTTTVNGETVIDFTHANTLDWHYNESIIYLNCRHTNTFYKINQTTGELIWSCGEFGNFTLLNAEGNAVKAIWFGCHDLREIEPNVFAMFNNDFGNITNFDDDHSAMQEHDGLG